MHFYARAREAARKNEGRPAEERFYNKWEKALADW